MLLSGILSFFWSFHIFEQDFVQERFHSTSFYFKKAFLHSVWSKYSVAFESISSKALDLSSVSYFPLFVADTKVLLDSYVHQFVLYNEDGVVFSEIIHRPKGNFLFVDDMHLVDDFYIKITYTTDHLRASILNNLFALGSVLALVIGLSAFVLLYIRNIYQKSILIQCEINAKLKTAKESAEQENLGKSNFIANVTHELRTPLNSIIGFSKMIQDDANLKKHHTIEYAKEIYDSGSHLLSLINDILDFSKYEANKLKVESEDFDLVRVLDSCIAMMSPKAKECSINLIRKINHKMVVMRADQKRTKQVLINLLSNAIKFTQSGGFVELSCDFSHEYIFIKVSDNGIGIDNNDLPRVMSSFGQASCAHHEGTGLGLPLSQKLVELMGGEFILETTKNDGTTITLKFINNYDGIVD